MAFTALTAASSKFSAVIIGRPESLINCRAAVALVPSSLTTNGTFSFIVLSAPMIPLAIVAQFTIPPNTLTRTALTRSSDVIMLKAALTCSSLTLPPTSKKLAGSPPWSLIMSIVAIANPAPLTRHLNKFILFKKRILALETNILNTNNKNSTICS